MVHGVGPKEKLHEDFYVLEVLPNGKHNMYTYCTVGNGLPLNIHHTVNIGQPWLGDSICDHGFISLPYLDGPDLEIFQFNGHEIHCYWFIPITEKERDYKTEQGCEALEQLFESKQINYLSPNRKCLIANA